MPVTTKTLIFIRYRITMTVPVYIIDTFTSVAFRGNPTGVCLLPEPVSDQTQLAIAKELNFPVTAFIVPDGRNNIRYFTPLTEIPACGHATLAAARVTFDRQNADQITFYTINGVAIGITLQNGIIVMTYPRYELEATTINKDLLESLSITGFVSAGICNELETLFIELDSAAVLRAIQPDYKKMVASDPFIKEVVITSVADTRDYDFLLRSFCPWIGIDEDPVTGSVHAVLANFWKQRLHKSKLKAYQCSERGGELLITAFDDKVELGGKTVVLMKGEMTIPDEATR
jgi:PhzF family phenazine biosynthesis protein